MRQKLKQLPEPAHPRLTKSDWLGALGIFLLSFLLAERRVGFRSLRDPWADTTTPPRPAYVDCSRRASRVRELIRARTSEGEGARQGPGGEAWPKIQVDRLSTTGSVETKRGWR